MQVQDGDSDSLMCLYRLIPGGVFTYTGTYMRGVGVRWGNGCGRSNTLMGGVGVVEELAKYSTLGLRV